MATGYLVSNGTDLDNVFDPYVQGSSPAQTGYKLSNGADINTRYAPLSFGSAAAVTGYKISSGSDLNTLFAAKGTAAYWPNPLPWDGVFAQNRSIAPAEVIITFNIDGDFITQVFGQAPINRGRYLPAGASASDYSIKAVLSSGVGATETNISATNQSITVNRFIKQSINSVGQRECIYTITVSKTSDLADNRSAAAAISVNVFQ